MRCPVVSLVMRQLYHLRAIFAYMSFSCCTEGWGSGRGRARQPGRERAHCEGKAAVNGASEGAPVPAAGYGPTSPPAAPHVRHALQGVAPGDHVIDLAVAAGFRLYTFTSG
jgi:hypothetical protein